MDFQWPDEEGFGYEYEYDKSGSWRCHGKAMFALIWIGYEIGETW